MWVLKKHAFDLIYKFGILLDNGNKRKGQIFL